MLHRPPERTRQGAARARVDQHHHTYLNATRIGLKEAMEKVDERNRSKKVTSSGQTDARLPRNEDQPNDGKGLVH